MKIYLVRHGESVANRRGVHNRDDERLTKRGIAESEATAERLSAAAFDIVFVSPSRRALSTASLITERHRDIRVVPDARLRERDSGIYAGTPHGTRQAAAREAGIRDEEFRPAGGESLRDMEERVQQFMQEVTSVHGALTSVLIVSHLGPIAEILRPFMIAAGTTIDRPSIGNGSITLLDTDNPEVVTILADVSHISELDGAENRRHRR